MKRMALTVLFFLMAAGLFMVCAFTEPVSEFYVQYEDTDIYTMVYNYNPKANEAILFIPGLGGSYEHAAFLFHPENRYMTIAMENLNHNKSGKSAEISWDVLLGSIKAVVDHYGLKKVNLVGHSFGADMAMMFSREYPRLVKDIVLIDRAYYNFADLEEFNFTRPLVELLEYNPFSGLSHEEFCRYLDLGYSTDISQTWNLKKKTLLIGADPSAYLGLPDLVMMIKLMPEAFGLTPEMVEALPDITVEDAEAIFNFLNEAAAAFGRVSNRFDVIQAPYPHNMVMIPELHDHVRHYVLGYLKNRLSNQL